MKNFARVIGTIFALLAMASLFLPLYHAEIEVGDAWSVTLRGVNLVEFSAWGTLVRAIPLIFIAIAYSRLNIQTKTVLTLGVYALDIVSLQSANTAMRKWIYTEATGYVASYGNLIIYGGLVFSAVLFFYLYCNIAGKEESESVSVKPIDILKEKFLLCPHPVEFTKMEKRLPYEEFNGCMSFSTEEGYFTALGHGVDEKYIKNGCVEVADDDRLYGFAMRSTRHGVYGSFYEDYANAPCKKKILPYREVSASSATLLIPAEGGSFSEHPVTLNPVEMMNIGCYPKEDVADTDIDGAVIIQHGKIAAVVSGYDAENAKFDCVSAELVAADLARMVYEQKVLEDM